MIYTWLSLFTFHAGIQGESYYSIKIRYSACLTRIKLDGNILASLKQSTDATLRSQENINIPDYKKYQYIETAYKKVSIYPDYKKVSI